MPNTFSNFSFDKYQPKTNCILYKPSLSFTNVSKKAYPANFDRNDITGVVSGDMMRCYRMNSNQCGDFGADAGKNICPPGTDLLLRHQIGPESFGLQESTAYTWIGTQNNICFFHDANDNEADWTDCYYATLDKCGKIDSTSCDIGTATATITGHRLIDPRIRNEPDAVRGDGVVIPQTSYSSVDINVEGVIACYYQYDFSTFITNGSNSRNLATWINDLYDGINYIT